MRMRGRGPAARVQTASRPPEKFYTFVRKMSSDEDSCNSDGECEVFFGPITEKEEQIAARYRNRLTEVFQHGPLLRRRSSVPSLACLEEKDEQGCNTSFEGSPSRDVQDFIGQISTGYKLSSVGVGSLHGTSQLSHPTLDSELENEELFALVPPHEEMRENSKDGITDDSLHVAVGENDSQKSWEWSLSDNSNLISRSDCSHISCESVPCLHSRSEGGEEPYTFCNESVAPGGAAECVAPGEAAECVAPGEAAESVAPGEAAECVAPGEAAECVAPGGAAECVAPGEAAESVAPGEAAECVAPGEAAESVAPGEAAESVAPGEAAECVAPGGAAECVARGEAAESVAPGEAAESVAPGEAAESVAPGEAAESVAPGEAAESVAPGEAAESVAPGEAAESVAPGEAAESVAPGEAAECVAPGEAAESVAPGEAAESVAPGEAAESVAPGGAAECVAPGEAAICFSNSLKSQLFDIADCSAKNDIHDNVYSSIDDSVELVQRPPVEGHTTSTNRVTALAATLRENEYDNLATSFNFGDYTLDGSDNTNDIGIKKWLEEGNTHSEVSDETKDFTGECVVLRESVGFLLNSLEKDLRGLVESSDETHSRIPGEYKSTQASEEKALISTVPAEEENKRPKVTVEVMSSLPEAVVGTSVPESAVSTSVPESAVSTSVPESAASTSLPESAASTSLPESAASTNLPESAASTSLPESAASTSLPESAASTSLPESAVNTSLPESAVSTSLPESAVSTSLPESAASTSLPESAASNILPESAVNLNDKMIDQLSNLKAFHELDIREGNACMTSDCNENIMAQSLSDEVMTEQMDPFDVDPGIDFLMEIEAPMDEKSCFEVEKSRKVRQSYYSALEVINVDSSEVYGDFLTSERLHDTIGHEQCHSYEKSRSSDDLDVDSYGSANKAMVISHSDNTPDSELSNVPHSLSDTVSEGYNVCVSSEESREYRSPPIENYSLHTPNMPQKSCNTYTDSTKGVQSDSLKFSITSSEEVWEYGSPVQEKCSLQTQNTPVKACDTSDLKGMQLDSPKFNDTIEEMEMMLKYGVNYGEAIKNDVIPLDNSTRKSSIDNDNNMQHMVDDSIIDIPRKSSIASSVSNFQPVLESTRESLYQETKKVNILQSPSKQHSMLKREPPPKPPRNIFSPSVTPKKTIYIKASTPNTPKHTTPRSMEVKGKCTYNRVTPTKKMARVLNETPQKLGFEKNKSFTPIKTTASKLKSPSTVPRNPIHCSGPTRSGSLTNIRKGLELGQSPVRTPTSQPRIVSRLHPQTSLSTHNTPVVQKFSYGMLGKQPATCSRLPPRPTPKRALKSILKQTPTEGRNLQAQSRVNFPSKAPSPAIPRYLKPKRNIESPVAKYLKENPPPSLMLNIKPRHKISPQKMQSELASMKNPEQILDAHQGRCGAHSEQQQQSPKLCEDMESSFVKQGTVLSNIQDNLNILQSKMESNQACAERECILKQPTPADMEEPCLPSVVYSSAVPVVLDEEKNKENDRMRRFMEVLTDKQPASVLKHKGRVKVPKVTFQTPPSFPSARGSLMEVSLHESHEAHYTNTLR
ncbi:serine-rich adhesin for platelets [Procambarus clarkii]|uniref:serine-rich adhesin for platelets n=1 Tax=Procambarus clarkii TaxID=6728 RepID=UPI0037438B2D